MSELKSDAYPAELTGAVSVNFLFIARMGEGWGSSSAAETGRQCDMLSDAPIVGHSEFTGG